MINPFRRSSANNTYQKEGYRLAKIEITKTELVWPGKYDDNGKLKKPELLKLPFQVIETINETHASRDARKHGLQRTLFDTWDGKEGTTFETGWKNKLIWEDNKYVMSALLEKFATAKYYTVKSI